MVALTYYDLRRLARHKATVLALIALPLLMGLARLAFARADWSALLVWLGPVLCAAATAVVFYLQNRDDAASGLLDALASAPIRQSAPTLSRLLAGLLLFGLQAVLFAAVLGISF